VNGGVQRGQRPLWRGFKGVSPLSATIIDGRGQAAEAQTTSEEVTRDR
jgi:hypothetical protein